MKNDTSIISAAAHAAENASTAAASAADAAKAAAANAQIAAKAAADSATAIAVVATDTSWMKKSLSGIEETLSEMSKAFVTAAQHAEVIKEIVEMKARTTILETNNTRVTVLLSIGIAILSLLVSLLTYHLFQR